MLEQLRDDRDAERDALLDELDEQESYARHAVESASLKQIASVAEEQHSVAKLESALAEMDVRAVDLELAVHDRVERFGYRATE